MALTPVDEIHQALEEAYDAELYESYYRQIKYAFGEKYEDGEGLTANSGDFPDFPAVRVRQLNIGQSRRILTAQFVDTARNMYAPGEPEYPDVDRSIAAVRKAFFLKRGEQGDWDTARCSGFIEGNGLGVGFLQGGVVRNPATGKLRTQIRHSPTCFTLWDPHEPSAGRAGYVCFIQNLPLNRAIALYGDEVEEHMVPVESGGRKIRTVRIFEYYDLGLGRWEPTQAIIVGKMRNDPIKRVASLWTDRLPMAFYEHFLAPGMCRPVGRIPLMMSTQEAINEIEARLRFDSRKREVDVIDPTFVDPSDLAKYENGTTNVLRSKAPLEPGRELFKRYPAEGANAATLQYLQLLQQQFNEDSGTTEYDRGGKAEGQLTAFEVNSIQQASAKQGGWTDKQTAKYAVRTVELAEMIAAEADEDPVTLNVLGHAIPFNDPDVPESSVATFVSIPSRVLVDEESLRHRDLQQEGAVRIGQLNALAANPNVAANLRPDWLTREYLRAIGEQDTDAAMLGPGTPGQTGATVGPDGQPIPPGEAPPEAQAEAQEAAPGLAA